MNRNPIPVSRQLPGFSVKIMLEAMKQTCGSEHEKLLDQAGLQRFRTVLPASNFEPAATIEEVSALFAAVHDVIGRPLLKGFLATHGRLITEAVLEGPVGRDLIAEVKQAPPEQRVSAAVKALATMVSKSWSDVKVKEDDSSYMLSVVRCHTCARIRSEAPMCADAETFYTGLMKGLTGRRMTFTEVSCRAAGDSACVYKLPK
jgi:predicted hydrocarbon binding protein